MICKNLSCKNEVAYEGAMFCGAACSQKYEMKQRKRHMQMNDPRQLLAALSHKLLVAAAADRGDNSYVFDKVARMIDEVLEEGNVSVEDVP